MKREISVAFQTDKRASEYIELAKFVNDFEFDAVSVYCDAPYHQGFSPLLLMAQHITKSRIGIAAVSPSRIHPIDIAAEAALLANVAQAGTYLGIARGAWLESHGITEKKPALTAIRESVEIVQQLLAGNSGGYDGRVFQIAEHVVAPYPVPEQKISILIGTWGKKLCAIAGELADEVKIGGSTNPNVVPVIANYIAVGEDKANRERGSVGVVIGAVCVADDDRELARAEARRQVALYLPVVANLDPTIEIAPDFATRLGELVNQGDWDGASGMISDDLLDKFAFSGNADDLIRQGNALFEAGASRVEYGTPHGLKSATDGLRIIGKQVLPELRRMWQ
ncbi:MAG: LLM class flavin-dependent oxidoreductase [Chloroflexota bacterium]